ncbi:hypothetical protein BBB39_13210 [Bordetella trematum]|uniref:Uncharacterized protein n=1 Tax=Bordetella trematum TaxID=123899 RepID=A0A157SU25_9BORD|nr:hypothetical protein [Bordetella trematum]AZR94630.1 hypothetical protein BBB39_13210 [Bordetella trematum]NNH19093.1 hypothetical protein [Bordetella trematum]SAI00995.1 Uncharacterised protein [Bordetella trematum]SAI73962.1 Uncharacterised protein [Bordetella trematum]SUV97123.1 Uncharacterised protein [Bordetella trematum]
MKNSVDILNEFTKEELIAFVREKGLFLRISRRDLLFIRWRIASEKLLADYDAEFSRWEAGKPDFAKRDALAAQCNATTDHQEKLRLLLEIEPYDKALHDHLARIRKLDARQKAVDRMYRDIERAAA